ncbi:MAG: heavy-metal-associated domain-containing protein [Actinomycetota bacterium]|nr:heavy-metal-associated domain-containing protein [Actinomycetota bacterium]
MSDARTYRVTGMTCQHCVEAVTRELRTVAGVDGVEVALGAAGAPSTVIVTGSGYADADVRAAIDEAGYDVA